MLLNVCFEVLQEKDEWKVLLIWLISWFVRVITDFNFGKWWSEFREVWKPVGSFERLLLGINYY